MNVLPMNISLVAKLGSIVVHIEEATSPDGHEFDAVAFHALVADPEVQEWLQKLRKLALVPVKRKP